MREPLSEKLNRLCCAETEGQFFDCVTDNIQEIIRALRYYQVKDAQYGKFGSPKIGYPKELTVDIWNEAIEAAARKCDMNSDWLAHEIRKLKR